MADHRPNRYVEGGRVVYRASALGSCVKSLVALGMGMTPEPHPDWLLRKFDEGIAGEPVVVDMLRPNWRIADEKEGHYYQWHDGQMLVEVPVGRHVIIRGHADAIGTCFLAPVYEYGETEWETGDKRLIEVKCTTEDYGAVVLKKLPPLYAWQVSTYGGFFGLPVMLALGIKDGDGQVVNVVTQMIDKPPYTMSQVKQRVIGIESCVKSGELPVCDYKQWPCPFSWLCDDVAGVEGTKDGEILGKLEESIVMVRQRSEGVSNE